MDRKRRRSRKIDYANDRQTHTLLGRFSVVSLSLPACAFWSWLSSARIIVVEQHRDLYLRDLDLARPLVFVLLHVSQNEHDDIHPAFDLIEPVLLAA